MQPKSRQKRFQKLRALRCYEEMYERMCSGWSIAELARFVQDEREEYKEISRGGLIEQLKAFRKTVPAGHLVQKRFPEVFDEAKEKVEQSINELQELEELYRIQMHRIGTDFAIEKNLKKLMPSMTSEIREARQLLETIANLKMEMGVTARATLKHAHQVNVDGTIEAHIPEGLAADYGNPAVKAVLDDPESRRKVMGVVERFLKLPASAEAAEPAE